MRLDGTLFHVRQRLRNLLSEFSCDTYFQLVLDPATRMPDFRTTKTIMPLNRYEAICADSDWYFDGVDCKKQYATCTYKAEHRWPQFSKLDCIEPFDGTLAPGMFFVQDFHGFDDCSYEGKRFYNQAWCEYHLYETGFITESDITRQCKASFSYSANMFESLVEEVWTNGAEGFDQHVLGPI